MGIKSVEIQNFKSIKDSGKIELGNINVLVGANSSGKSNFIEFFNFLKNIADEKLHIYIVKNNIDNVLHFGRKKSNYLSAKILFHNDKEIYDAKKIVKDVVLENNGIEYEYSFSLTLNNNNKLVFAEEKGAIKKENIYTSYSIESAEEKTKETSLRNAKDIYQKNILAYIHLSTIYHFNDTSMTSNLKTPSIIGKNKPFLDEDGRDIALFLYNFSKDYPKKFKVLEKIINSISPSFKKFYLVPDEVTGEIYLQWIENDINSTIFPASCLSDGTLRFICLAALLMHPIKPMTIILDEPELGLHPFAIEKLGAMIDVASEDSQIILSTQSAELIGQFSANDIIVVERKDNETIFKRQSKKDLENWIKDYSMGEIWCSNIIGGNP